MEVEEPPAAPHRKHSEVRGPPPLTQLAHSQQTSGDSDTDLSESERGPEPPSCGVPPQLELNSEVIKDEEYLPHRARGRGHGGSVFPDFLPPPFNSWNLSQLAVFYNTEGRAAPRPPSSSPLQQYLQKLLQLEGLQLQSVQEERGTLQLTSSCQRSGVAAAARLSSPKCILQCQRVFSCTFLSPHTTLLSGCVFSPRSTHRAVCCPESRLSPPQHSRGVLPVPKRSYSESRVQTSDRVPGPQRSCSPSRTSSYLRRMQASGNLRNPDQGAAGGPRSAHRSRDHPEEGRALDCRKRSGSEQRTGRTKRPQNPSGHRQSRSECRKGRAERRRAADCKNKQMKADAVPQNLNRFPCSRCCQITGPSRSRAAELVLEQQV